MTNQIAGTAIQIDLALQDDLGAAQDLSAATEITWRLTRAYSVPGILVKTKTGAGVAFDTDGINGLLAVAISPEDSLDLQGLYYHEIKVNWGSGQEKTWQLATINFSESSVGAD